MKSWLTSPKTTIGAAIAVVGLVLIMKGEGTTGTALIGIAAAWIGVTAKDTSK